jgi:hypothetical protein
MSPPCLDTARESPRETTRRVLTRQQVRNWNENWSYTDREIIDLHLNRLAPVSFYEPPSGGYVGCVDVHGQVVMTLHAGYLKFKRNLAPEDRPEPDWPGLTFSTFRPHAGPTPQLEEGHQVCTTHNTALPLTGICDECQ